MDYARIDCATSNGLFIAACNFCRGHGAQYQCYSYMDCCYSARNQCRLTPAEREEGGEKKL